MKNWKGCWLVLERRHPNPREVWVGEEIVETKEEALELLKRTGRVRKRYLLVQVDSQLYTGISFKENE
jgi:hypothetical protein